MTDRDALISRGMAIAVHAAATPERVAIVSEYGNRTWSELNPAPTNCCERCAGAVCVLATRWRS
jgi:hypothetical protein